MKQLSNNISAFFALLRAGLWNQDINLSVFEPIDFKEIYRLSQEQSVVGLITAGLEHVVDIKVPKEVLFSFVGETLQIEQRNTQMNCFVGNLFNKMTNEGLHPILVKGQGIAQCYNKPLWRACGDVDVFLDEGEYSIIDDLLMPLASSHEDELEGEKHKVFTIDSWIVEIHGNMPSRLMRSIDSVLESIQKDTFDNKNVRKWNNNGTVILLPESNNDVFFVFTHFLKHFFHGGIGLRQICDWCRLLWKYRESIDVESLESRIKRANILTEWKAFADLAVEWLGMPKAYMPLYSSKKKWKKKAGRIIVFILQTGNFGHNRDMSYAAYPVYIRKIVSLLRHTQDSITYSLIFPLDSVKTWFRMFGDGLTLVVKGK